MKMCRVLLWSLLVCSIQAANVSASVALPRPPMWPPLPELSRVSHRETFDELYYAGVSNAVVTLPNYGTLHASWSGYSLERMGAVTPLVISGLGETGQVRVATDQGAIRFWFQPYWSSGTGPGAPVTLAELAAVNGSQTAILWSLRASADGSMLHLLGPNGSEVLLATEIDWTPGNWHQVVLNYGTNGTELVLDGEKVAEGTATLAVPGSVARLAVGSSLAGEAAGGDLEEVYCFARPLKVVFHYTPFAGIAALGPISEDEQAYKQELLEKWKASKAEQAKESEGGVEMLRLSGPSANCVTNGPVYLTNVVANFTTNDGWTVYFDIAGGTNGVVYDIFSTTDLVGNDITNSVWTWLETGMTCETHWFTNQPTSQVFYILTLPGADRDADDLYDGWEWKHFGTLEQASGDDYDGDGDDNATEFSNGTDPNTLWFDTQYATLYVSNRTVNGSCVLRGGVPRQMALLIDSTNLTAATWVTYNSNFSATLPDSDGGHTIFVALRGLSTNLPSWDETEFTLDRIPPVVAFTNPAVANATVIKPYLQLQGFATSH